MIADERADALVSNFAGQWLQLRNLESKVSPDLLMFPDFDDNTRRAFRRETEMLFGHILRENQQRARAAERRLHVPQRAPGEALRHPGRLRRALPPGEADGSEPLRPARPRQRPVADGRRDADVAGLSAASTSSPTFLDTPPIPPPPNVPTLEESNKAGAVKAEDGARAARAAPRQRDVRGLPSRSSIRRASRSSTSTRSASGETSTRSAGRSTRPACSPTARRSTARSRCARRS